MSTSKREKCVLYNVTNLQAGGSTHGKIAGDNSSEEQIFVVSESFQDIYQDSRCFLVDTIRSV